MRYITYMAPDGSCGVKEKVEGYYETREAALKAAIARALEVQARLTRDVLAMARELSPEV